MPTAALPPPAVSISACERWSVRVILLAFVVIQINSIRHSSYMGQDYITHVANTNLQIAHPASWIAMDATTRPLQYWIGALCHFLTGGKYTYGLASVVATLLATVALGLVHAGSRRFIASPSLRVAALAFIAFVPATLVTAVVYAADTFTLLPFALAAWSLVRSLESSAEPKAYAGFAALAGVALCLGNLAKLTFIALPFAALAVIGVFCWWKRIGWRQALVTGLLAGLLPLLAGSWFQELNDLYLGGSYPRHRFDWHGTGEMTWRSLLGLKRSDARIFAAPTYWDTTVVDGQTIMPVIENNGYSYPALLHLAIFTDVLDFTHGAGFDRLHPRPELHRMFARWSVRTGVVFYLAAVAAVLGFCVRTGLALVFPPLAPSAGLLVWGVFALAWYAPLVLTLPYVHAAYSWGYWLPRLVLPALWGFGLILFATLDRFLKGGHTPAKFVIASAVLIQSALQIRSVWY
jgi:hypothetical protein